MASYNPNAVASISKCKVVTEWNAYFCENDNLSILLFESLDADKTKRTFSPIILINQNSNSTNILNTFMDHS